MLIIIRYLNENINDKKNDTDFLLLLAAFASDTKCHGHEVSPPPSPICSKSMPLFCKLVFTI